jgi:putative flippase GtrA
MTPRSGRLPPPVRFAIMSALSFATNLGITTGLHEGAGVAPQISFAVALVTVFLMNFAGLRWWIFAGTRRPLGSQFAAFGLSSLAFRGLEYGVFLVLLLLLGVDYRVSVVVVLVTSMVAKYAFYDSWLFSRGSA